MRLHRCCFELLCKTVFGGRYRSVQWPNPGEIGWETELSEAPSLETVPQYISIQHRVTDISLTLNFKMANNFYQILVPL